MKAYSLINYSADFSYSMGIYTSLDNLYVALKDLIKEELPYYPKETIKNGYAVKQVYLDSEPRLYAEFSLNGLKIDIDWEKIF